LLVTEFKVSPLRSRYLAQSLRARNIYQITIHSMSPRVPGFGVAASFRRSQGVQGLPVNLS